MGLFQNNQNPEVKLLKSLSQLLFLFSFIFGIMDIKHQSKIYWKWNKSVVFYLVWVD